MRLGLSAAQLLVSSAVSLSVPLALGRIIDYFTTGSLGVPLGLSTAGAGAALLGAFAVGAAANAGRMYLMKRAGQRLVARLREAAYEKALVQDVAFVERGEGDILSRLASDTAVVGESVAQSLPDGLRCAAPFLGRRRH